jgi:hypothetical protein
MIQPNVFARTFILSLGFWFTWCAITLTAPTQAFAHAGHEAAGEAPKGPFVVASKEDVFLPCANDKNASFRAPFEKITLRELTGYKNDFSVLLGADVKTLAAGDQLKTAKLVTEKCEKPFKVRCDKRGQPVMLQYKASQKDVFCQGRFNFIIEYDKDVVIDGGAKP